jgi:protease-4
MRRALLPATLVLVLCLFVSNVQTKAMAVEVVLSSGAANAETQPPGSEQADKDQDKSQTEGDQKKSEKQSAKARIEAVQAKIKARMQAEKAAAEAAESKPESKPVSDAKTASSEQDAKTWDAKKAASKDEQTAKASEDKAAAEKEKQKEKEKTAESEESKTQESEKEEPAKKPKVVCFTLRGEYPEGPASADLFSEIRPTLSETIDRIDTAAKDKDVAAVWLKFDDLTSGRGKINELRAAIARLRKAKKPVYAELTVADTGHYLVASACDEVFMPESGALMIPGVRAEMMFYKGLLDKIGIEVEDLKMGKYKGALEPFTRRDMSQPLRESLEALVDDLYSEMTATIAADRHMNELVVKSLMDHGLFTAEGAKKAGLIDHVLYSDQFEERLKKKLGAEALDIVTNYKTKTIETDFSGIGGLMKFMELLTGGKPSETAGKKQKIAVVYAVGTIIEGKSSTSILDERALGSNTLIAALQKAADNPKVAAVVLRIDSPGGSATASDLIWRKTIGIQKPLVASMGDVAGSGGYYIAMGAKKIYAEPGTLTGSIGVIGGKPVLKGLYDKLGLNTEVISRGANSGALSYTHPYTPEERRLWTDLLGDVYRQFVSKAAKGRNMSYEKLEELAQGRVYTGRMAKGLGLIDELGTLEDAIIAAKTAAGLKPDADVDLLILPEPKTIFEQLFGDQSSDVETGAKMLLPANINIPGQMRAVRKFFSEPALLWMPYRISIK